MTFKAGNAGRQKVKGIQHGGQEVWRPLQPGILHAPPPPDAPIRLLERLWLLTCCTYELFDEETMEDRHWDAFAANLQARKGEWSTYFAHCLPSKDFNVGTTGSGVRWTGNTVARVTYETCVAFYGRDPLGLFA